VEKLREQIHALEYELSEINIKLKDATFGKTVSSPDCGNRSLFTGSIGLVDSQERPRL
jgi:hypothetical protein